MATTKRENHSPKQTSRVFARTPVYEELHPDRQREPCARLVFPVNAHGKIPVADLAGAGPGVMTRSISLTYPAGA